MTYRTAMGGIGDDPQASAAASAKPQEPPVKTEPKPKDADAKADAGAPSEALPPSAVARLGSVRLRTAGSVMRLAFSPDGTRLASYSGDSYDDELTVWDTKTGRALRRVERPGVVRPLAWLPDGRGIALTSSGEGRAPLVWEFTDEKAEKPQGPRPQPQKGIKVGSVPADPPVQDNEYDACFAVSPDGKILAVGRAGQLDGDRPVQFWEFKTGVRSDTLKPLKGGVIHPGNCGEVRFTPDAKTLVVITPAKYLGDDKWEGEQLVTVWDVRTSRERVRFKTPRPAANGARPAVAVSDTTLAIGLEGGDTSLWDLATGKERKLATGHVSKKPNGGHGTYAVAFGPGGKTLATGGWDNTAKLWDVATGKLLHTFASHDWVEALAVSPDGKLVASAGQDGQIRLWDAATGADACPLPGHKYIVGNVALTPDGKQAVTSGWDNTIRWWDVATGEERRSVAVPGGVRGMALSPDGKVVLAATDDGGLRTWDFATGRETTPANLPADAKCETLSFTPDGKHIVAAAGPKVTIWEWPALKVARTIDLPKPGTKAAPNPEEGENHCQAAAVSPDGKWLVTVANRSWYKERDGLRYGYRAEGVVDVWEFATGKRVRRLAESSGTFRSGTFTADGRFVLIGGGGTIIQPDGNEGETFEGQMNLLDPAAGKVVRGFDTPREPGAVSYRYTGASAVSPDGRTLWVSYNTGEIVGFEVATGRQARTLVGHRGYVGGLAFTTDGRRLISGSQDGTALVWDMTPAGPPTPRDKP
ncbi:MAG: sigE 14 [Gemmataceae bacterium]|nr:sigE 14 [Gemmataceae bacterium]